ncbi:MAG: hypothetical protein P1U56_24820 [Saprospiraceae bacterium]|nr:hypothetical protein [Saprospiraceae bacterium]
MYKPRHITFKELITIEGWQIKSYTISESIDFQNIHAYQQAVALLSDWILDMNSFNDQHESIAFLIEVI